MANFTRFDYLIQNGIGKYTVLRNRTSYAFDDGINSDIHTYAHFRLLQDDPNVDLSKGTRLIVRMADSNIVIDRLTEQIYLVNDIVKDDAGNRKTTTFFTRAGMTKLDGDEPHPSNLIYFSYNHEIRHTTLRHFKSIIDGIVVKVFMDPLTK